MEREECFWGGERLVFRSWNAARAPAACERFTDLFRFFSWGNVVFLCRDTHQSRSTAWQRREGEVLERFARSALFSRTLHSRCLDSAMLVWSLAVRLLCWRKASPMPLLWEGLNLLGTVWRSAGNRGTVLREAPGAAAGAGRAGMAGLWLSI